MSSSKDYYIKAAKIVQSFNNTPGERTHKSVVMLAFITLFTDEPTFDKERFIVACSSKE
jgi:hypothetical protein